MLTVSSILVRKPCWYRYLTTSASIQGWNQTLLSTQYLKCSFTATFASCTWPLAACIIFLTLYYHESSSLALAPAQVGCHRHWQKPAQLQKPVMFPFPMPTTTWSHSLMSELMSAQPHINVQGVPAKWDNHEKSRDISHCRWALSASPCSPTHTCTRAYV